MNKKIILVIALALIVSTVSIIAYAEKTVKVVCDGKAVNFPDAQPYIESGRTLVPIRAIAEKLEAEVIWDNTTQTVTFIKGADKIILTIGENNATKNGNRMTLDVPAKVKENRTYVPLRFIGEGFGKYVTWDDAKYTVLITDEKIEIPTTPTAPTNTATYTDYSGITFIGTKTDVTFPYKGITEIKYSKEKNVIEVYANTPNLRCDVLGNGKKDISRVSNINGTEYWVVDGKYVYYYKLGNYFFKDFSEFWIMTWGKTVDSTEFGVVNASDIEQY